jgi:CheY-like chemotaxis protein
MYYRPPPLRGRPLLVGKKVLLIDSCQVSCEARASVLRNHGVEVHAAADLSGARFLWHPNVYRLIMLDVRRYSPGDALEFCEQIREASPHERIAFLVGPPTYLSLTWPGEVVAEDASSGQWRETVNRFLAAA